MDSDSLSSEEYPLPEEEIPKDLSPTITRRMRLQRALSKTEMRPHGGVNEAGDAWCTGCGRPAKKFTTCYECELAEDQEFRQKEQLKKAEKRGSIVKAAISKLSKQ